MGESPPGGIAAVQQLIENGITAAGSGTSTIILVEGPDGTLGGDLDDLPVEITRVVCASSCGAEPGRLADVLDLESHTPQTIVVEEAQSADATSLGRLERILASGDKGMVIVLAHRPQSSDRTWAPDELVSRLDGSVRIERLKTARTMPDLDISDIPAQGLDLLAACSLITGWLPVSAATKAASGSEEEILRTGELLVDRGLLQQGRGGFSSTATGALAIADQQARIGNVAARLADAMDVNTTGPGRLGQLRLEAGQPALALPLLVEAARGAAAAQANSEAHRLAESALRASSDAGDAGKPGDKGSMHLISARFLRSAGRTAAAQAHAEHAVELSAPDQRAEALHLAAMIADDSQRPQRAEYLIAMAELSAKSGSSELAGLLAFHARTLSRLGFATEADATQTKAEAAATVSGSETADFIVGLNKAWIHFDRGEMNWAEREFTRLRDHAERIEGRDSVADKEAWRARSLFPSGHPDEALEAISTAETIAGETEVEAPLFLADLAVAEGATLYGRTTEAHQAAERALDLVARQLPAWENMALATRARVRIASGELASARSDLASAIELTPAGADGWRWRSRCRALAIEADARAGEDWLEPDLEDLADQMLQAKLYGWAAEVLCAITELGGRRSAASDAVQIALYAGQPILAARATHAAGKWDSDEAAPVILAIHAVDRHVPADWRETWSAQPHIRAALDMPAPIEDPDHEAAARAMASSLAAAGLSPDSALSPAQRRSSGLVMYRPPSRRRRGLWAVAAGLGVIALAAGTAWGVSEMTGESATETSISADESPDPSITAAPASLEDTQIAVPADVDIFFGTGVYRGSYQRTGLVDVVGPREVDGYYWRFETAGPIEAGPITFGSSVYVGTTEGTFYNLDQTTGAEIWTMPPDGRIAAAPGLGQGEMQENQSPMMVVVVDDNGVVRGQDAAVANGVHWSTQLGERIRSSPVIDDGRVFVATNDGFVYGLDLISGEELWRFPAEGEGLGQISADLSFHSGILYIGTESNTLHLLDVATDIPSPVCEFDALAPIVTSPIITDEAVYVGTTGQNIWTLPVGACSGVVPNRLPFYVADTPVRVPPAIIGDTMYLPAGRYLYSIHLPTNEHQWPASQVTADSPISTPPVVAADVVYVASEDGVVRAVDATSGETLWTWTTDLHVRAAPAVANGVVFIAGGDGFVYALGPG